MQAGERILALALGGALSLAANAPLHAEASLLLTMRPLMAVDLDVGTKHLVSYFLASDRQCKLTLMIEEKPSMNGEPASTLPERVQVAVDASKTAHFDSTEGKSLEFICNADAQAMIVVSIDRVAFYSGAE